MIHNCQCETITVVRLGSLDTSEVDQALHLANELQNAFYFKSELHGLRLPLDEKYKLPNGGYDLCGAVKNLLLKDKKYRKLPRPLIVISSAALGDPDHPSEPDWFYFSSQEDEYDPKVSIISTQPLSALPRTRTLENYLLMMLSTYILSDFANVPYHRNIRGCLLDYCDELKDAENALQTAQICDECEVQLQKRLRQNQISMERIAAAMRLLNRAAGRRYCFVMMPFNDTFAPVHEIINDALIELGWKVKRADQVSYPRLATDLILKEILSSDLVVADLSNSNPNVFYEVGLAHTLGNDLLLITQEKEIPFDLKNEQTIFYNFANLQQLKQAIQRRVGSGLRG